MYANSGKIGGWTINSTNLSGGGLTLTPSSDITGTDGTNSWSIKADGRASFNNVSITGGSLKIGNTSLTSSSLSINKGVFKVTNTGEMTATSGKIGGWVIDSKENTLKNEKNSLILNPLTSRIGNSKVGFTFGSTNIVSAGDLIFGPLMLKVSGNKIQVETKSAMEYDEAEY
jgi:hypothetical protein